MESTDSQNQLDRIFNLIFDNTARDHIKTMALWARICAICAFVGYIFTLIESIFGKSKYSEVDTEGFASSAAFTRVGNIIGALVVITLGSIINYFLYQFAASANRGVKNMDQLKLNEGLRSLKTYFKILGVLLLIVLVFVGLIFLYFMIYVGFSNR
jgi:NADH:ubiquinone oxidoreductase subunit 5 (subunit L)/multisubunit Na+/H+ antiporter MnhA subunit